MAAKTFRANHRFARITARKARPVMDLVRGQGVNDALSTLRFVHRRAAPMIAKVIRSALANAGQDLDVDVNHLVIADARADDGPLLGGRYRWRPRAQGRVYPIRKRTSHLSVILEEAAHVATPRLRRERPAAPAPEARPEPEETAAAAPSGPEPGESDAAPDAPDETEEKE